MQPVGGDSEPSPATPAHAGGAFEGADDSTRSAPTRSPLPGGGGRCEIVEVGPRDGLQNEAVVLDVASRVALIELALDAGLRRIEAVSFVRGDLVPQMAGAEEVMAALPRRDGVSYSGLVLNQRGLERAVAAGVDEVNAVVGATDSFSMANQKMTTEQSLAAWREIATGAHSAGIPASVTISVAFGCPFEGEVAPERIEHLVAAVAELQPAEVALADTIGCGVPSQVRDLVARAGAVLRRESPRTPVRCHFHNTRNTGYANALAAFESGVAVLDASIGGAGGCPFAPAATGNVSTEDLVYLLHRMGVETGVDLEAAIGAGRWLGTRLGSALPSLLGRAGPFPRVDHVA